MLKHADKINMEFTYVPSRLTDVAETFRRIRERMEKAKEVPKQILPMKRVAK